MSGKEYTAKSVEEALEKALNEMMLTREDIHYEVVQHPSKGFLGFGQKDAIVRVSKKEIEATKQSVEYKETVKSEEKPEQKIETKQEAVIAATKAEPVVEEIAKVDFENYSEEQSVVGSVSVIEADTQNVLQDTEADIVNKKEAMQVAEEKGRAFLAKIFEEMDLDVTIDVTEKSNYLMFDLKGDNLGILIGRRGDTLDALQFLLNLVINDKNNAKVKGIIDIENYRAKREETLVHLGHKLAGKARRTGQKVILEPMNPQERRIIHMALQNDKRVKTYSEGEEPFRKVVIEPVEGAQKPYYKKNYNKSYHSGRKSYDRNSGKENKIDSQSIEA